VTLGIFDGVHRGHLTLLKMLILRASEIDGESVVITFSPHPRLILENEGKNLLFLTTMEEKIELLEKAGIDNLVIIKFDSYFSRLGACDFVKDILVDSVRTSHLILGFNHHFGKSAEGDYNTIKECVYSQHFIVEQAQGLHTEEGAISSSLIREALLDGRLDEANKWLGYSYSLTGSVVGGKKIGREIGFPTANIVPADSHKLIPQNGVYAVHVALGSNIYRGMMSIGTNPTINRDSSITRTIEVYIIDFSENIYGSQITVIFRKRLRNEIRFDSREQLIAQMELDKKQSLEILK